MNRVSRALVLTLVLVAGTALAGWKAGDQVEVEWSGSWYEAEILEVKDGQYKVHYAGWDAKWDEVVEATRVREKGAYKVGDKVSVEWKDSWYDAEILEAKDGQFKVHYEGWESTWDEWVEPARIHPLLPWKAGDVVQVDWNGTWYDAKVLEVKDGQFKIHYEGWEDSHDEWVTAKRIREKSGS